MDILTLIQANNFTRDTVAGMGALKGEPCTVQGVESVTGGEKVTLHWTDADGGQHSQAMTLKDAYGIWLALGNTGTQQDFIDSLKITLNGLSVAELVEGPGIRLIVDEEHQTIELSSTAASDFPKGGRKGQVLTKKSDADSDVEWADQSGSGANSHISEETAEAVWPDPDSRPQDPTASDAFIELARYVIKFDVPRVSGTLTYNGAAQSPTLVGFDPSAMSITGNTETDAGDHIATVSLKGSSARWSDGTRVPKQIPWSILRAAGSASADPLSIHLTLDEPVKRIAVTRLSDGPISAASSDDTLVSATVEGDEVVVSSVDEKTGSAVITISVGEGRNYTAAEDITVSVTAEFITIWGVSWDGTSTTKLYRTDAAEHFPDPVAYKPGLAEGEYFSPFDSYQPWAGMVRSTDSAAGELVAIPKFWYKLTQNGNGMKVQIANGPQDGFQVSPAHMDRGDGKGERNVVYIGRYHCHTSNYKSQTGGNPRNNETRSTFRSGIHGLGNTIWMADFAMRFTIWLLYLVEFADWNSQGTIGAGCGNNSSVGAMGYTDTMPYHTGTTQATRETYGCGTQYRNIEGLWDNVRDWIDGCYYNSSGLNIILNPASSSDSSGGTAVGVPSSGYPSKFTVKSAAGVTLFYPTEASGSDQTYSCDNWDFNASYPCLYVGGSYYQSGGYGLFCVGRDRATSEYASLGSRLQVLP